MKYLSNWSTLKFYGLTGFLFNRIDFLLDHKLSPVQLTWLHPVYGKIVFLTITSTFDGVCGMLCFTILNGFFAKI